MSVIRTLVLLVLLVSSGIVTSQEKSDVSASNTDNAGSTQINVSRNGVLERYRQNRKSFQDQRDSITSEIQSMKRQLLDEKKGLEVIEAERTSLISNETKDQTSFRGLRQVVAVSEKIVMTLFYPLLGAVSSGAKGLELLGLGSSSTESLKQGIDTFLSIALCVLLVITLAFVRTSYNGFYQSNRKHILVVLVVLLISLPFSTYAQEIAAEDEVSAGLEEVLIEANRILELSYVQRNIRNITMPENQGRRMQITLVNLSGVPLTYFESFVVGSGEYFTTLAALHHANNDTESAIQELSELVRVDVRYSSKPDIKENLIAIAAVYLLQNGKPDIAADLLNSHISEMRMQSSFDLLYAPLIESGLTVTSSALADRYISITRSPEALLMLAKELYKGGSEAQAEESLSKAVQLLREPKDLKDALLIALRENEIEQVQETVNKVQAVVSEIPLQFSLVDLLRKHGRHEESMQLLVDLTSSIASGKRKLIDGKRVGRTAALVYVSYNCFERGIISAAQMSALEAIKPLSRAEKSALVMRPPPRVIDANRIPKPEILVAPLYTGLLLEAQNKSAVAHKRYRTETRLLIESLIDSSGLFYPDMINHLTLLGGVLSEEGDVGALAELDEVLTRFEQQELDKYRASRADEIANLRTELDGIAIATQKARSEVSDLEMKLENEKPRILSVVYSAIFLPLRALSMLLIVIIYITGAVVISYSYAKKRVSHKTYALVTKAVESAGWIYTLTIFNALIGIPLIVLAQNFMLKQTGSESTQRVLDELLEHEDQLKSVSK